MKNVVQDLTSAGLDWAREKWKFGVGSKFIRQGEKNAVKYADEIIVLSKGVQKYFMETYGRETHFIPNGVNRPEVREAKLITDHFGLEKDSYILFLGRLVPEKGIRYLVEAFKNVKTDKKLVIAGGSSDTDSFMEELKELAKGDDRILFTGFVQGAMLDELYSNAYIYTLPSDLEGMPLSLLEAMSYGNCCLVSDIPECAEVVEDKALIFKKSDVEDLREKLQDACDHPEMVIRMKNQAADFICEKYNWDEALGNMGLSKGNVLEPSCGIGNFMGLVPDSMEKIRMYGVELDSISGRIAQQLYQKNKIAVQGFETMQFPDSFFDCVVGNVPFGNYKVPDKRYDRHNFLIHDYFIAKSLDLVRPGGMVAVVTSSGTMDKKDSSVREYLANRADLVGAIRLPNNAFQRNANTGVVADILFLQKRDRAAVERADWVDLGETPEGHSINQYFAQHPEMVLGEITTESTQYGKQETTVKPIEGADLARQLKEAVSNIQATITEPEISDDELDVQEEPIPADPNVKNFSFTNVDGQIQRHKKATIAFFKKLCKVVAEKLK